MSKWRVLYEELRSSVVSGQVRAGTRLPSTRDIAEERGVSRSTVIAAVEQLIAEGFLESRAGSGTYVVQVQLSGNGDRMKQRGVPAERGMFSGGAVTKDGAASLNPTLTGVASQTGLIDFRSGQPDLSVFPWGRWERAERQARLKYGDQLLRYARPEGLPALREAIASYLGRVRGLRVDPDRLIVCNGTTQAISILGGVFASLGVHTAWLEDPVTADIVEIFRGRGITVRRAAVDDAGIVPSRIADKAGKSPVSGGHICFVTPSHQFPTGAVLSLPRRLELIGMFKNEGSWLVEDDYDSEFRFDGPPLATLASLDADRVVYIGTFSKTLAPGLRTAYIHVPQSIVDSGRRLKWASDLHNPPLIQAALAEFLDRRFYDLHVRTMRKLYQRKRNLVCDIFERDFPGAKLKGINAGMHARVVLRDRKADSAFVENCRKAGIVVYPVSAHASNPGIERNDFILGYGHLSFDEISEGLRRLKTVL